MTPVRVVVSTSLVLVAAVLGLPWVVAARASFMVRTWAETFEALVAATEAVRDAQEDRTTRTDPSASDPAGAFHTAGPG
jgi:uncharacterized membrane protein